ncbi:DUF3173 family protein [Lactococcus cremoris]|uniref:DUF3173 family protein n=1 Tax=Lactococcus lactis subsp. cremoris TaxID=1359 RepID=UPI00038B820B|nr:MULTISPECIES: DUF3173 family protein [Lactococcus]EQC54620.1 hypothetical protein LLT5_06935 [Lactococcus cremoris subsp. cremoris TIFN5]EQC87898.1 hypothetical protein LLT1_06705 [Lactococcus cremoris subsp. cremoris TIFN1]AXN65219.1 hypothetical protein L3107_0987 [Lactococcus cremoris]MRM52068.1 DUF3173 domain-containing protein [Lactococcus cremoris]OAJ97892.1 plasmid replication protein [Lactococcus lactis]
MIQNITKSDIMILPGYSKNQAQNILRKAKASMVSEGFVWYSNKRVSRVPIQAVEAILGYKLDIENIIINDVSTGTAL